MSILQKSILHCLHTEKQKADGLATKYKDMKMSFKFICKTFALKIILSKESKT